MTKPRDLPNKARWTLEEIYAELEKADRLLSELIDENTALTRSSIISLAARAISSIRLAREHVVSAHPSVRTVITKKGGPYGR